MVKYDFIITSNYIMQSCAQNYLEKFDNFFTL